MIMCPLGFRDGYPYSHPHTLFFLESANVRTDRFRPEQLRAKMLMFAFGNALAKAKALHGVRMGGCCWASPSSAAAASAGRPESPLQEFSHPSFPVQRRKPNLQKSRNPLLSNERVWDAVGWYGQEPGSKFSWETLTQPTAQYVN